MLKLFTAGFLVLFACAAMAQTVHQVEAGNDQISAAFDIAAPGDIIELVTDGGLYVEAGPLEIDKSITIRGPASTENKPVLRCTDSGDPVFKVTAGDAVFIIENIEIDGTDGAGSVVSKYLLRLDNGDVNGSMVVKVLDCVSHDFSDKHIKCYPDCGIDSLIVDNSIFYNGAKEGITLYSGSSSDPPAIIDYASITNSTFYGLAREAVKGQTYTETKVMIDRNTFYDIGSGGKSMVYFRDMTDVEVKNSIFVKNDADADDEFADFESDASLFHHNAVYDVVNANVRKATVSDTLHIDPEFADPDNGDFTLPATSVLLTFADDGGAIGDPRWDPDFFLPTVHMIEAGTDQINNAVDAAEDGDIIELVTSGGLYYETGSIKLADKKLTVRAQDGLVQKPVVQNDDFEESDGVFKIEAGGGLTLQGVEFFNAKHLVRVDNDSTNSVLKIDDCYGHTGKETLVKLYAGSWLDSLIITNTIFRDAGKEGIYLKEPNTFAFAHFENCTFIHTGREAIRVRDNDNAGIRINHCTFDSITYDKDYRAIYPEGVQDVEIKNTIISNKLGTHEEAVKLYGTSSIHHVNIFNSGEIQLNDNATMSDTLWVDPLYFNPAKDDYRLADNSPCRGAGDDGRALGDLRWEVSPNQFYVSLVTEGKGSLAIDPPGGWYGPGTSVTLTATPDAGWGFVGWSDNITVFPPDNPVVTITVNDNMTITAYFESLAPKFTLDVNTRGLGTVTADPGPNDNGEYEQGSAVTLTAVPGDNWDFEKWTGDVTAGDTLTNPVVVTVDSNMSVTANFMPLIPRFTLDVDVVGEGDVMLDPGPYLGKYDTLAVVRLHAMPVPGWEFAGWSGDLESTDNPDSVVMDADKNITVTFEEIMFETHAMEIDTTWDLRDAVEFANNNSYIDSLVLVTSGGLYTSTQAPDVTVMKPLTIVAGEGLEKKPIVTNSDHEGKNDDIFRVFDDFTIKGVVLDGGHPRTHGPKYGIRLRNYTADTVKTGTNITVSHCDFVDFFEEKDLKRDGHCFKIDVEVAAGVVKFENCTFTNTGYEAIRISDTEKWVTDRALDSLVVRNCTFTNIDAEAVRYYSDIDPATPDPPVLLEHITINNSATRVFYLKNSGGAVARDIIIANSRESGHGRDDDLLDVQGNEGRPSYVSHIDTFMVKPVPVKSTDGVVDTETIWGIDPMFEDAGNLNYALLPESHLYGLASDGEALGDLNWAVYEPVHVTLSIMVEGKGDVHVSPLPVGLTYDPDQTVTLTAVADSGYEFVGWSGDITSTDNPVDLTLDGPKNVVATFEEIETGIGSDIPDRYSLGRNYPNPFNPETTIKFGLKAPGHTTITVYDMLGRKVTTLVDKYMAAGRYDIRFYDVRLSSGVYFYTITSGDFKATRKMMLMK